MRITAAGMLLALSLAGCGSSGDDGGPARPGGTEAGVRYAECMRANGVPDFPDPVTGPDGRMTFDAPEDVPAEAFAKCKPYLPFDPAKDVDPERVEAMRRYATCMRDNGLPGYPDPEPGGGMMINWAELGVGGPDDPKVVAAAEKCRSVRPSAPR